MEGQNETQTKGFWANLWRDKLKCLYLATLVLQLVFIILQFIPFVSLPTAINVLGSKTENFSMVSFHSENGGLMFVFIVLMLLYAISITSTIGYFVRKGQSRYTKFRLAKTSVILILLWYVLIAFAALGEIKSELRGVAEIELSFAGHLYWLVAVVMLVLFFITGAMGQQRKVDELVAERLATELEHKEAERLRTELEKKATEEVATAHKNDEK